MQPPMLNQGILSAARIIAIALCLIAPASAQTPNPTPPPQQGASGPANNPGPDSPPPPPREYGGVYFGEGDPRTSFSEALKGLADRATNLLPIVRREIEGRLLPWLEDLSWILAGLVMIGAFAKMWRENAGAGVDLFWWFARLGVVIAVLGSGSQIINGMYIEGRAIATGEDGQGALLQFYINQQHDFDTSFTKFTEGVFTIGNTDVKSTPGGLLGVLLSNEASAVDPVRKLDGFSKDMPVLYDSLNFSRGVISFGDLFLTLLGSFLMIVMRLAAPVMIALAIDRSLAQRVTYPYLWGVIVLTLIWPIVTLVIKSIAYMGGNIAMALGDDKEFHKFDENTMQIIQSGDPFYTALFAAVIMLISGLCLWTAPYIAYQLSVGRVYEGVSQTISSWVGQLAGAGIALYSAQVGAAISRQADVLQADAQQSSEGIRAAAGLGSGEKYASASRALGLEQTFAHRDYQNKSLAYGASYQNEMAGYQLELATNNLATDYHRGNKELTTATMQQATGFYSDAVASYISAGGRGVGSAIGALDFRRGGGGPILPNGGGMPNLPNGGGVPNLPNGGGQLNTPPGGYAGHSIGGVISSGVDVYASYYRFNQQLSALNQATEERFGINKAYREDMILNQKLNTVSQIGANNNNAINLIEANNASAGQIAGGYNKAYDLTMDGNRINYRGAIDAATEVRTAAVEAARLRSVATMVNAVGSSLSRGIDGISPRY